MFPRLLAAITLLVVFGFAPAGAQSQQPRPPEKYQPVGLEPQPPQPSDLFEASVGFNYIYLNDQYPETKNLYGFETSAFVNATSWLAAGGEFMADFGTHTVPSFFRSVDVESQRYVYVFGPRITVWQNPQFRLFAEALAGGVHARAKFATSYFYKSQAADGLATVLGAGFDWRMSNHLSWRVVQADYLGTNLGNHWQTDFRASTGIVYLFGRR
ncbi:MAG TPA: hypothetical protein VLK27_11995 [Chthoniobacterales bacterium]|nr:hypothetical protein [Chthoniobacterales bacterium]